MNARDVLHRLVDDLDDGDALLFASAASGPTGSRMQTEEKADLVRSESERLLTAAQASILQRAADSGIWPEQAQTALREWLAKLRQDPRRFAVLSLIFVTGPPQDVRERIAATLASWQRDLASSERTRADRARIVADALGSVRAEGLEPSTETRQQAARYEAGQTSADEVYAEALGRARGLTRQ
ncbi:MAG: hypothetical protein GEV12_16120 [Micromonosporaceae bacterium]|nr:hypothetical protein [Micromonosporaceae bacterium]